MAADKDSFLLMIQSNKGIILKICNTYCSQKTDREDLAQEIIYNLWKAYPSYTPSFKISTWLYKISLNVAISFYRKDLRTSQFSSFSTELLEFDDTETDNDTTDADLVLLQQFIQELKELDKSIILLYLDQHSYTEIADIVGITETNVATRLSRIKVILKEKFENIKK